MKRFFERLREWRKARDIKRWKRDAEALIQVREDNGEMWLTYADTPIVPLYLFTLSYPVSVVETLRERYVERRTKNAYGDEVKKDDEPCAEISD